MKKLFLISLSLFSLMLVVSSLSLAKQEGGGMTVVEAKLGTGIQDRMLTEEATEFELNSKAYIWLKLTGGTGDITVTWKSGDYSHSTTLNVGGIPWRTWAEKTLRQSGEWTVTVTSSDGAVLKEVKFSVK